MIAQRHQQQWQDVPARRQRIEWLKCRASAYYFIHEYTCIYDAVSGEWIPFRLWPAQADALHVMLNHRQVVALKARQIGLTWLVLGYALWLMLFQPAATVLAFSRRDDEAVELVDTRLKGMYERLPRFLQSSAVESQNKHEFGLANGSRIKALPTTAGDSYTATLVIGDEFDLVTNQGRMMDSVKPTIDNGGRMVLLSRADKSRPNTDFKNIYRAAKDGSNDWAACFIPWYAHPGRDAAWYAAQREFIVSRTGNTDSLYEQYPATDTEALAGRTSDKRFAPDWVVQAYQPLPALSIPGSPAIPQLQVYEPPEAGHTYVLGADPAQGNPTSNDSAFTVLDAHSQHEVASLAGKFEPSTFAAHIDSVCSWYNQASAMVERNNHGHAVLLWLRDNSTVTVLPGHDHKPGWHSTSKGKALLYDAGADALRDGETAIRTWKTQTQIASIVGSTLKAPEGDLDDLSDSFMLALVGAPKARQPRRTAKSYQG